MGRNLGPLNIKDSYEGLVQISGSQLTDGSGSLISNLEVTASYATIADTSISASYAQTSTSASHALVADLATTASYVENAVSASYAVSSSHSDISDFAFTATSASYANNSDTAISSSYAFTASYADNAGASTLQEVLDNSNTATGVDIIITGSYLRHSASFSGNVIDNLTTPTSSEAINHLVYLTQAEYNALTPDNNTLYVISGSSVIAPSTLQEVLNAGDTATGSIDLLGSIKATSFTGSLQGNATTATSASYALVADLATTASYVENSISASYAVSSSHSDISDTSISASHAVISDTSISSSYSTFSETSVSSYTLYQVIQQQVLHTL
jgi:hypothetical protein